MVDELWDTLITSGEFTGVIVRFGRVRFAEQGDGLSIQYDYTIVDPSDKEYDALTSERFKSILHAILEKFLLDEAYDTHGPD